MCTEEAPQKAHACLCVCVVVTEGGVVGGKVNGKVNK